jgi:hypothetical protein
VSCKRVSLCRDPLGNQEEIRLPGSFERKKYTWVPFFHLEDIKVLRLGAIWNISKRQGSPELLSDYGAQAARL